jgi:putative DNA primase/helicase
MSIQEIRNAMLSAGVEPPPHIEIDGRLHRYDIGKKNQAGWYCFFLNPLAGAFGDWRQGVTHKFCLAGSDTDPSALAALRQAQAQRDKAKRKAAAATRLRAGIHWRESKPLYGQDHAYLRRKQISAHGTRQDRHGNLVVPVYISDEIASLQLIKPDGTKLFMRDGKTRGGYFRIGEYTDEILIAEGFATAATLFEETGYCTYAAFNAGNLNPVAQWVSQKHPDAEITICGDNDHATEGNPGKSAAIKAANAIGGKWVVPDFNGLDYGPKDTDFNDYRRLLRGAGQ